MLGLFQYLISSAYNLRSSARASAPVQVELQPFLTKKEINRMALVAYHNNIDVTSLSNRQFLALVSIVVEGNKTLEYEGVEIPLSRSLRPNTN